MALTPEQRQLRSRMAGHACHAKHDSVQITAPARAAFLAKFEKQVDPDGVLTPEERARRAEHAKQSYFAGLALKSATSRRKRGAA